MKISKKQLEKIIQEEISKKVIKEEFSMETGEWEEPSDDKRAAATDKEDLEKTRWPPSQESEAEREARLDKEDLEKTRWGPTTRMRKKAAQKQTGGDGGDNKKLVLIYKELELLLNKIKKAL